MPTLCPLFCVWASDQGAFYVAVIRFFRTPVLDVFGPRALGKGFSFLFAPRSSDFAFARSAPRKLALCDWGRRTPFLPSDPFRQWLPFSYEAARCVYLVTREASHASLFGKTLNLSPIKLLVRIVPTDLLRVTFAGSYDVPAAAPRTVMLDRARSSPESLVSAVLLSHQIAASHTSSTRWLVG